MIQLFDIQWWFKTNFKMNDIHHQRLMLEPLVMQGKVDWYFQEDVMYIGVHDKDLIEYGCTKDDFIKKLQKL